MLSSLSPIAGGVALFNIMLSEIIFGGVGVGLCSMLMFVLLTVFLSGLMIGRTPEYMGKKIEKKEIQWVSVAILLPSALILIGSGISMVWSIFGTTWAGALSVSHTSFAPAYAAGARLGTRHRNGQRGCL